MKFTLVRFKEDKRPVCVLGGHLDEQNVFCAIDEWHDPMMCEYTYVEISKYCFSWCWYGGVKTFKEKRDSPTEVFYTIFTLGTNKIFGSGSAFAPVFATIITTIGLIFGLLVWKTLKGGNPE